MANVKWFLGVASKRFAAVVAADYLLLLSEAYLEVVEQCWRRVE